MIIETDISSTEKVRRDVPASGITWTLVKDALSTRPVVVWKRGEKKNGRADLTALAL